MNVKIFLKINNFIICLTAVDLIRCGENEFQCDNKKCINKDFNCDGDNDCGDWTDEDSCPMLPGSCNAGEFR